jgi:hypothetical protein
VETLVMRVVLITFAALVPLAIAGCGGEGSCGTRRCDIRQPSCQRALADATGCLLGEAPVDVPITVERFEDFARRSLAEARAATPEAKEILRAFLGGLALFGLGPKDVNLDASAEASIAWVGAFYEGGRITVLDRGVPLDSAGAMGLLVHELAHAHQDASGAIADVDASVRDLDSALAASAVLEGGAILAEDLAYLHLFEAAPGEIPWGTVFSTWQGREREDARVSATPVIQAQAHFSYAFGGQLAVGIWRGPERWQGLRELARRPPRGTAEVLARIGAGGLAAETVAADPLPSLAPRAPLRALVTEQLGAFLVEVFLSRVSGRERLAPRAPLIGDRLTVHGDPATGRYGVSWQLRFATEAGAEAVRGWLSLAGPWELQTSGRDLVLTAGDDPDVRERVRDAAREHLAVPAPAPPRTARMQRCRYRDAGRP